MLGAGQALIVSIVMEVDEVRLIKPASASVPSFTVPRSSGQLGTGVDVGVREGVEVAVGVRVAVGVAIAVGVAGRAVGAGVDVG